MASRRPTSVVNIAIRALDETKKGFSTPIKNAKDLKVALGALKPVGIAAGAAIAGAFTLTAKSLIDTRQRLAEFSDRIGISIEQLSRLKFAAEQSGVGFNELQTSLQRMTRRVGEGTTATADALNQLGLSLEELQGLSADQQFDLITRGFDNIQDSGQRAAVAMKLFDTEGVKLLQMLGNGSAGLRDMTQQADNLGLTITEKSARAVQDLNEKFGQIKGVLAGLVNQFLQGLLPSLNALTSENSLGNLEKIHKQFQQIGKNVGYMINSVNSFFILISEVGVQNVLYAFHKITEFSIKFLNFINGVFEKVILGIARTIERVVNDILDSINDLYTKIPDKLKGFLGLDSGGLQLQLGVSDKTQSWFKSIKLDSESYAKRAEAAQIASLKGMERFERSLVNIFYGGDAQNTAREALNPIKIPPPPRTPKLDDPPTMENPEVPVTQDGLVTFRPMVFSETFEQFIERYKQVIFDINNIQIELFSSMDRGMTDAFASIIDGTKSASKAFQDMGKQMLSMIAQIIAKLIVANILTKALGFFNFGGGGDVSGILGGFEQPTAVAGIAHAGLTNVPNEGTYLLQKGERVIAPQQNEDLSQYLADSSSSKMTEIFINLDGEVLARSMENLVDRNVVNINASSVI